MRKIIYLLNLVTFCSFTAEDPLIALLKKLEAFSKKYPTEKVYLHMDKPYYAAGDDIWFKAYVTDSKTQAPTERSSILYVELINSQNRVEKQLKLRMENGLAWADFKLADTLSEGNYRVRAYTQWMRNAGPNFFFDKAIKIGNSWTNKVFTKTTFSTLGKDSIRAVISFLGQNNKAIIGKSVEFKVGTLKGRDKTSPQGQIGLNFPKQLGNISVSIATEAGKVTKIIPIKIAGKEIDIQFLPEGGTLLLGVTSKIGIKAIGPDGRGLVAKGKIVDQSGTEAGSFETSARGMGFVYLNPQLGKTYTASVAGKFIPLPKAASSGYSLALSHVDSTKIKATVHLSTDLLNKGDLYLVSQKNGVVYWDSKLATSKTTVEIIYKKEDFPQGIIQFTLFSPTRSPVCERIVFVRNTANELAIELSQLKPDYNKKERVELALSSSFIGEPVTGSFSVAVTNADAVAPDLDNESNILTTLLLTSDLTGYVEKPNSYFLNEDASSHEALDLLMLTQGWRKIDWKLEEPKTIHPPEKTLKISGVITKSALPLPNSKVSLINNKDGLFVLETVSDQKGKFSFDNLEFIDSTKFIVQARTEAGKKEVQIKIDIYPEQVVTQGNSLTEVEVNVNQSIGTYLQKSTPYFEELTKQGRLSKTIMLKEVKIEGDRKSLAPNSQNLNGPGNADQVIDVTQLPLARSVAKYLQGRVMGVTVQSDGRALSAKTFSNKNFGGIGAKAVAPDPTFMRIVLDGQEMGKDFGLGDLDPHTIESIEVLTSLSKLAIYGANAQVGLFIVTTKKGGVLNYNPVKYAPGLTTYGPKGYYPARTFYSPKYDIEPSEKPDLRTTVHWAPNLVTDETGRAAFNYFNTDQPGNYRIVIEGMDAEGNITRKTYTYKVN